MLVIVISADKKLKTVKKIDHAFSQISTDAKKDLRYQKIWALA